MAENFQTCPGCSSLILSDTPACPECGHAFRADAAIPVADTHERGETVHQTCPQCGDDVPAGLVRCWSCNSFMRNDVAEKYRALVDNPQPIIFSDVPPDERTETIPPRAGAIGLGGYARINDDGEAEFILEGDEPEGDEFELSFGSDGDESTADPMATAEQPPAPATEETPPVDESESVTATEPAAEDPSTDAQPTETAAAQDPAADKTGDAPAKTDNSESPPPPQADADSLLDIALTQEKEADVRKRERKAERNRKRIMVPCPSCGVWLKVREEQSGKSVRCRKCRAVIPVPKIKRKAAKDKQQQQQEPQLALDWVDDVHMHLIVPTEIALKPASLKDAFEAADVAFHTDGLHFVRMTSGPKKKSLFSRAAVEDLSTQRTENRAQIQKSGSFKSLKHGETHSIPVENLPAIRLVQPIRKAHESMFAGVSVFGEGRIAFYLPLKLDDDRQVFCSMPLSQWRVFSRLLHANFEVELPTKENGVPDKEMHSAPPCHYTQNKVEALRNVEYYENDDAYELELTGYRCVACSIAVSEAARAKNKLGGAKGKSIAKAKCPACSAKFGREPLYRITKSPEAEDDETATDE